MAVPLADIVGSIVDSVSQVIVGKRPQIERVAIAMLCGGHVLIDDVPGTGKTMLARSFAASMGVGFRRLQCTPDLLPNDVTGVRVFDPQGGTFRFEPGPIFTNILLADEINRATPRTQAALLEAMAEGQVTVDGDTRQLPQPFLVLATQNPVEFEGTFPLPEAQLDRFMMSLSLGYPSPDQEQSLLSRIGLDHPVNRVKPVFQFEATRGDGGSTWMELARLAAATHLDASVEAYIVAITGATRNHQAIDLGASPRATIALAAAARALAAVRGRDYVLPDDVKELAAPVIAHRLVLSPEGRLRGIRSSQVVADILSVVPVGADP
ncbi:MAG TPA: MoxR family ATPase [Acidimicrobiia bacterium]|nr:MoxR family ATPase [Acidimicrobiia bacterium]